MTKRRSALDVLADAKTLAGEYYSLTGKPLGITGEVAEYEASRLLGVKLTEARHPGYDATELANGRLRRYQIKSRCLQPGAKPAQRLGSINVKDEWDAVLMVLLDSHFEATEIYEANREPVLKALSKPGSISRNKRHALGVNQFKAIATLRWSRSIVHP